MNNAIVICYVGKAIQPEAVQALQQIITNSCNAMPELINIKHFDSDSIAKAILARGAENVVVEDKTVDIVEEARKKAITLIKSKYSGITGAIKLAKDIAIAKYHSSMNMADDEQTILLEAVAVIADIPEKELNVKLQKALRDTIITMNNM